MGLWLLIGLSILILFIAAMHKRKNGFCAGSRVQISANNQNFFITQQEVNEIINAGGNISERTIHSIDIGSLESAIKKNPWVKNAELYFDNSSLLHIDVEQRVPIARLFCVTGYSSYIDNEALRLPIKNGATARVLAVTGFPSDNQVLAHVDSLVLNSVKILANFIYADSFWNAQIAQIDITSTGDFELISAVGNLVIKFGNSDGIKEKFDKLYTFYKQAWLQNGINSYETLDLRFHNQIVATRNGFSKQIIDSVNTQLGLDSIVSTKDSL